MNLIGAKVYYDGSHWIAIPHTERPVKRKRRKRTADKDETVEQFEKAFNKTPKGKKAKKKEKLLKEFAPLFKSETEANEFVETQFERLNRNRIERYKRLKRKAYLQQWHYFCTFTYSDEMHTEETFRKQLMNCLYHLASRKGWRYIGAWERGDKTERLHFHALIYIPPNAMVGEFEEHNDFNFKTHNRQITKNSIEVTYLLRNKLKCGYCGQSIIGECGTAKNGERKYYYKCRGRKMKLNDCKKSAMSKDDLEHLIIDTVISELKNTQAIENAVKYLFELQNKNGNENRLLNAYIKEQKDNERAIINIVANMERGIVAKATSNRLCELETRQEELERLILIEQSKQTVKITETQIRTFYEQALKYEPQMLINYIVKEIVMYDDRIDIIYNSPIIESPDDENRQGFVFNMKSVRLDKRLILIHFIVV